MTLLLDGESAAKINAMYKMLSDLNISHDQINLGYPPYLTLATLDDAAEVRKLVEILSNSASGWKYLSLNLVGFGVFPGTPSTLWICPTISAELCQRHAALCRALPISLLREHCLPDKWVPHVTLAKDLAEPSAAVAAVKDLRLPTTTTLVESQLIHFRPAKVL